ncbi:MAG TPA: hypothetical protein VGJ41_14150 [Nocardioides sp.]|jgi:hypothetical protein
MTCYFCLWDGWGSNIEGGDGAYLSATADEWPGHPRLHMPDPAFIWPADHAWCVANEVDQHWAGIGADVSAIDQLLADQGLDVAPAEPGQAQPSYR